MRPASVVERATPRGLALQSAPEPIRPGSPDPVQERTFRHVLDIGTYALGADGADRGGCVAGDGATDLGGSCMISPPGLGDDAGRMLYRRVTLHAEGLRELSLAKRLAVRRGSSSIAISRDHGRSRRVATSHAGRPTNGNPSGCPRRRTRHRFPDRRSRTIRRLPSCRKHGHRFRSRSWAA